MSQTSLYRPLFGHRISPLTETALLAEVLAEHPPAPDSAALLTTMNLDHVVNLSRDEVFAAAYRHATWTTIDGAPVYLMAKIRGVPVPGRITGADLFPKMMEGLKPGSHRPFFLVASAEVGEALKDWLIRRGFAPDDSGYLVPDFGFEKDADVSASYLDRIMSHKTSHLFMGVGAPKSEKWVYEYRATLKGVRAFCFGAGLEFFTGHLNRAPEWMQKSGLEWAWRVGQEPGRLFKRYFVASWRFLWLAIKELFKSRQAIQ